MTDDTREGRTDVGGFYRWREKSPTGEVVVECPGYWPDSSGQKCGRCGRSRWPHTTDNWVPTSDTEDVGRDIVRIICEAVVEDRRLPTSERTLGHYAERAAAKILARLRRTSETCHRVVTAEMHDTSKGLWHGCCAVCAEPWPCSFIRADPSGDVGEEDDEEWLLGQLRAFLEAYDGDHTFVDAAMKATAPPFVGRILARLRRTPETEALRKLRYIESPLWDEDGSCHYCGVGFYKLGREHDDGCPTGAILAMYPRTRWDEVRDDDLATQEQNDG